MLSMAWRFAHRVFYKNYTKFYSFIPRVRYLLCSQEHDVEQMLGDLLLLLTFRRTYLFVSYTRLIRSRDL